MFAVVYYGSNKARNIHQTIDDMEHLFATRDEAKRHAKGVIELANVNSMGLQWSYKTKKI